MVLLEKLYTGIRFRRFSRTFYLFGLDLLNVSMLSFKSGSRGIMLDSFQMLLLLEGISMKIVCGLIRSLVSKHLVLIVSILQVAISNQMWRSDAFVNNFFFLTLKCRSPRTWLI